MKYPDPDHHSSSVHNHQKKCCAGMPSQGTDAPGPSTGSGASGPVPSQESQIKSLHEQLQSALAEIGSLRQRALAESHSHASLSALEAESSSAGTMQHVQDSIACLISTSIRHYREYMEAGMGWLQKRFCPCIWHPGWSGHHDACPGPSQGRAVQGHAGLEAGV